MRPDLKPFRALPRSAQVYLVCVIAIGIGIIGVSWALDPFGPELARIVLYLAIGTQIAALRPIPWRSGYISACEPLLIATGLIAPGAGVALVAWLATFDGRVPGRTIHWWAFLFNRAMQAAAYAAPSMAVASIGVGTTWGLPVRTILFVATAMSLNYLMTGIGFAFINRTSIWATLLENVGITTLIGSAALSFSGGIIWLLLQSNVGFIMAPGLFGFVLAVRGNVADARRQTLLKDQTLDLAAQALDARDRYTESHSMRVAELAGRLGEHLELGDTEVELIRTAGSLHDLGKIGIRDDILNKPGPLTEEEWEIMRRHPDIGADMIAQHSALQEVAPLVRHHHERWDGSGYPTGLKGDVIPFGARILSVADSFDTITGARLYRRSVMTPIEGVEDISRRANQWYDPNVVDALREIHGLKPLEVLDRPDVPRRVTTVRVLASNPGFSSLLTAVGFSALGDPLTQVASLISIYAKTGDARLVALGFIVQALATILMTSAIGGLTDRLPRRGIIVALELSRATLLIATPLLIGLEWWLIVPILFLLACINAVVTPARQAAIPNLVPGGQVGKANAMIAATTMLMGAIGFGLAAAFLSQFPRLINLLFVADAATFVLAATIILGIPSLGGGSQSAPVSGGLKRSWSVPAIRPQLVISTIAALLIPMSLPALLALAYQIAQQGSSSGGQLYSILELISSMGIFIGSLVVSRFVRIGSMRIVGLGLLMTGAFSIAIAIGIPMQLIVGALLIASIGNPIYAVANQTALIEAADPTIQGTLMATRFGLAQTAGIVGIAVGGLVTRQFGAPAAYGVLGVGLVLLAMYALAAGRSTINPLHGAKYEEAMRVPEAAGLNGNGAVPPPVVQSNGSAPPVEGPRSTEPAAEAKS